MAPPQVRSLVPGGCREIVLFANMQEDVLNLPGKMALCQFFGSLRPLVAVEEIPLKN